MSQRTHIVTGLIIAICGTVVLGVDRLTARADSSIMGQEVTSYTWIGVVLLAIAAIWFYLASRTKSQK